MKISLEQLVVAADGASREIDSELAPHICRACGIPEKSLHGYHILKRSVDARSKPRVKLLYRLEAQVDDTVQVAPEFLKPAVFPAVWDPGVLPSLRGKSVCIVGAGPAGLFAALAVALCGGHPVVLERGMDVERRANDIRDFRTSRKLNLESNYLFGEGGAGTWSDGKLFTRVNDPRVNFVLKEFIACGAQPAIGYFSHPHIGSDRLPTVVSNLRKRIIGLGGEFRWGACVESLFLQNGRCAGVVLTNGEKLEADAVLIACGHSARGLISTLIRQGVGFQLKGFQVGMRIEHPQNYINRLQYGVPNSYPSLGAAEYNVVSKPPAGDRGTGATSFCMCPGGEIIPAVSEDQRLCTNGMSNSARDGKWANSAIITTISPEAFANAENAYQFLDALEARCFQAGGGAFDAPAQRAEDFVKGCLSQTLPDSSYCFGLHPARLDQLLPRQVTDTLRQAMAHFEKTNHGFMKGGLFVGIEARVSSPVRFLRNTDTQESSIPGLFLAGEGAGMAGGITSAAVDGLKMTEAICNTFSRN